MTAIQGVGQISKPEEKNTVLLGPKRRKVFFFLDSLQVGGTETQAVELARRLDPEAYAVTLGCLRLQGPLLEKLQGSPVTLREFHPAGGLDSPRGVVQLFRLAAFLRREKFDIVHTHDLWTNLMGVPAARLAKVPVIISSRRDLAHFDWYQGRRRKWLRHIQNLSDVVLANAGPIRDALIADDHIAPDKVRVIHNGVDVEKFRRAMRDREGLFPGIGSGRLVVLVGNMHSDVKGHPWLIEAAAKIVPEFPQTRFLLVGSGERQDDFARRVAEMGLQQNFRFLGRRDDIPNILVSCDMAVLPSRAEGLPNAVLEYMSAGLPVVASDVGGNSQIVRDGETGLLVPAQDANALAAALLRLLRDDPLASRLAQSGHALVKTHFSFERLVEETGQLYTELLRRKERAGRKGEKR
jgi:glycosyltransferase involved in cell wall biosynthesis